MFVQVGLAVGEVGEVVAEAKLTEMKRKVGQQGGRQ